MADDDHPADADSPQLAMTRRLVDLSVQRTHLAERRNELSLERTRLAGQRNEMSSQRTYLNAERTLSVWVRTSLAVMVVGIAIDRFGLFLGEQPHTPDEIDPTSTGVGVGLVALGVLMALLTAGRFLSYAAHYRRHHEVPHRHGPFLAPFFAALVAIFGIALIVLLLAGPV